MAGIGKDWAVRGKTAVGVENRIYFLGEIFWTEREPWKTTCYGRNPNKPLRAAMVAVKSSNFGRVTMIPGSSQFSEGEWKFTPEEILNNTSQKGIVGTYDLDYIRGIDRWFIEGDYNYTNKSENWKSVVKDKNPGFIGTISTKDKQRLADMVVKYMKKGETK